MVVQNAISPLQVIPRRNQKASEVRKDDLKEDEQRAEQEKLREQMNRPKLLPRETGHDIGMGSPVPLSAEMVSIITRLRNMKVSP